MNFFSLPALARLVLPGNPQPVNAFTKCVCILVLLTFYVGSAFSQANGDYRSASSGNWGTPATWQKFNSTTGLWAASLDYPGQNACPTCKVTIQGFTVTLNVSPANSISQLSVGGTTAGTLTLGTFALTVSGNLTLLTGSTINLATGTFTVNGSSSLAGTVLDNNDAGVVSFGGLVTKTGGTWTSTLVTTAANMNFLGGITNTSGTFSAGAATIADSKTLTGTVNMSFTSLNVLGNGDITIAGTATNGVSLTGAANYAVRNLNITGLLTVSTSGSFTVAGTTSITGSGAFTDNNDVGITSFSGLVTHASTGAWTSTAVITAAKMVFNGGFTNSSGAFTAGGATVGDNQTLTGTVNMSFANGVSVLGNGDLNIAGATNSGVTFGGAAGVHYSVRRLRLTGLLTVSTSGNLTVADSTFIVGAGAFIDNNNTGITRFTGHVTHSSTGTFNSTPVTTAANMIFAAGITNTAGSFYAGAATINDNQTLTGTINIYFYNGLTVLGNGDLNIGGTLSTGVVMAGTLINYSVRNLSLTGRLSLTTTGNLTVNGTTNITGTGSFIDNNNAGVTTFHGLITHNSTGVWYTTSVTATTGLVLNGGVNNIAGRFAAGAATIGTDNELNGTVIMTFSGGLTVSGTGNLTISGTAGVSFGGTSKNYTIPGNLVLKGKLLVSTSGNFTVTGTTDLINSGDFTDNNNTGVSTFNGAVTHNSTGRWVTTSVIATTGLVFNSSITNTLGSFSAGGATIADNQTLTGTVNMSFARGLVILGNGDITIAGTTTTGVSFGGTAINYSVRNLTISGTLTSTTSGNLTVSGTTNITGTGKFLDNNGTGITSFNGLVTVGANATFTATSVNTVGRLVFGAGIVQNNTTPLSFNVGSIRTSATQTWSGAGSIRSGGGIDVSVGVLTNNLAGSVLCVGTLTGTTFQQGTNTRLYLGNATPLSITTLTATATGNFVSYNGGSATIRAQVYHHLVFEGSGTKTIPAGDVTVNGDLTISAGVLSNTTNNRKITIAGNWINNVSNTAFAAGTTGQVVFSGSSAQSIGGTAATSFRNVTISNAAGVSLANNTSIAGVLTFTSGKITTGAYTVSIASTGSVVASAVLGYIVGNEQRNIATGTNVARVFDVGTATAYSPVTLTFASVSVAGNVTATAIAAEHPFNATSLLNNTLSVNRYWRLVNASTVFTTYTANLVFVAADKDAGVNTANFIGGRYNAGWTYPTVGTKTSLSTQLTGINGFGELAIAEPRPCLTPTVVTNNPAPFCSPATVNLTAAAVTAGSTPGLTYTYWMDDSTTIALPTPSAVAAGGTYYIKGTVLPGGCSAVQPVVVTRNNPTGNLSGSTTICAGSATNVSLDVTGTGPWTGTLSDGTAFSGSVSPISVSVNPIATTTLTISTLTAGGCSALAIDKTGNAVITVLTPGTPANAGFDQSICGGTTTLAANVPSAGSGSWTILSGTGGNVVTSGSATSVFTGTAGETYLLKWTIDNPPCPSTNDTVQIAFTSGNWTGAVNTDWYNSGNWCGGVIPSGAFNLTLAAGLPNYPTIIDEVQINDLSIASGASLSIDTDGEATIKRSYSNAGTIANYGSLILNTDSVLYFPGSAANVLAMRNLEIDNPEGVIVNKSFGISGTLTSSSGVLDLADQQITLLSTATGTARVAPVGGSFEYSGGGKFIAQMYMPARRAWRLITAPLTGTESVFASWQNGGVYAAGKGTFITGTGGGAGLDSGASSCKVWDIPTQSLMPLNNTMGSLSGGTGGSADNSSYFLFVRGDRNAANLSVTNSNTTTLSCSGRLQTGLQTFAASSSAGGFTMIGNPFASPIDFSEIARTNLIKRFYAWDPTLNKVGGYVMLDDLDNDGEYSSSVGGSAQTRILQSHQSFFVETAASGSASIAIDETAKSDGLLPAARAANEIPSIQMNLLLADADTNILADAVRVEFDNAWSAGVTPEDALKFTNLNETFALVRNNKTLALERRPFASATDTLFLKLTKFTNRNYKLQFVPLHLEDFGQTTVFLKDNYTGTETQLALDDINTVAFSVNSNPASSPAGRFMMILRPVAVLPVKYVSIKTTMQQHAIAVEWKVTAETNISRYEVEKSIDGRSFSVFSVLHLAAAAPAGTTYTKLDENPSPGNNFYRIKAVDVNGLVYYSQVVKVQVGSTTKSISIYPNPITNNVINLQFVNVPEGQYLLRLNNAGGQQVYSRQVNVAGNSLSQSLVVPGQLPPGIYQSEITGPGQFKKTQQLLVQ